MTLLVGVLCRDGAVIGADSAATFGSSRMRTMEQPTQKISIVGDHVIVAGTGSVGLSQRFVEVVTANVRNKTFGFDNSRGSAIDVGRKLSKFGTDDFKTTECPRGQYGALVAYAMPDGPHICELDFEHFQPEQKDERIWYTSMGSGSVIADPFLALMRKVLWHDGMPTLKTATFATAWTLQHAVDTNTGGVNGPIHLAVLSKLPDGKYAARMLDADALQETLDRVDDAVKVLRSAFEEGLAGVHVAAPDIPRP